MSHQIMQNCNRKNLFRKRNVKKSKSNQRPSRASKNITILPAPRIPLVALLANIRSCFTFSAAISLVVIGRLRELEPCVEGREGDLALPSWETGRVDKGRR